METRGKVPICTSQPVFTARERLCQVTGTPLGTYGGGNSEAPHPRVENLYLLLLFLSLPYCFSLLGGGYSVPPPTVGRVFCTLYPGGKGLDSVVILFF